MNILFLTLASEFSHPDMIRQRGIFIDVVREFFKNGHEIYVLTPSENRVLLDKKQHNVEGINLIYVKLGKVRANNPISKGISTILIEGRFMRCVKNELGNVRFDLVLFSTPPITFGKVVDFVKNRDNANSYLLLKDIFPQNAIDLGFFGKNNPIYWYFRRKEKKLYKVSDVIGCMSPANIDYLKKHNRYLANKPMEVCPNSIEPLQKFATQHQTAEIRVKYGIPETSTVFIYGGNLGKPQGVDFLIEVIKSSQINGKAFFVIVGGGTEYPRLSKAISATNAPNAKLIPFLPKDEFDVLLQASNVGLIFLDPRFTIPNFPSRLLSYLECSLPVLAATDTSTDLGQIIQYNGFGLWCQNGDMEAFERFVNFFVNNKTKAVEMGNRGRRFLEENYHVAQAYQTIIKHLPDVP